MTKKFKKVFPNINVNNLLQSNFLDCLVEKIYIDKVSSNLYINIALDKIVHPQKIEELESCIKEYLGISGNFEVYVKEKFNLIDFSFNKLYELYIDSICYKLIKQNPICGVKLANIKPKIYENTVEYVLNEQIYNYFKKSNVEQYIKNIFMEKFSLDIEIKIIKKEGTGLAEKFIESRNIEENKLLRKLVQNDVNKKVLPKKIIKEPKKEEVISENLLIGKKSISGEVLYTNQFSEETKNVILEVFVLNLEVRVTRSGKTY